MTNNFFGLFCCFIMWIRLFSPQTVVYFNPLLHRFWLVEIVVLFVTFCRLNKKDEGLLCNLHSLTAVLCSLWLWFTRVSRHYNNHLFSPPYLIKKFDIIIQFDLCELRSNWWIWWITIYLSFNTLLRVILWYLYFFY